MLRELAVASSSDRYEYGYTPSGWAAWQLIRCYFQRGQDWERVQEEVFGGSLKEEDIAYTNRYFEMHDQEILAMLVNVAEEQA